MTRKGTLEHLVQQLTVASKETDVTRDHIWHALRGALEPRLLIANLAEALRISARKTELALEKLGFGDLVAQQIPDAASDRQRGNEPYTLGNADKSPLFDRLFSVKFSPPLEAPILLSHAQYKSARLATRATIHSADHDAFAALYRKNTDAYYAGFINKDAILIDRYLDKNFTARRPRYLVNSGMGANELFSHFAAWHNNKQNSATKWLIIDSPKKLAQLPHDATIENTIFMEFSRSGKTEETVKIHEYTPREAKRIVFANTGPLREIGLRDQNLVLDLPDQVSGRFGRNKTPILLAPMHVTGIDTKKFWHTIQRCIEEFQLSSGRSLPMLIAQFAYLFQTRNNINHVYLGCDSDALGYLADELIQFWNEGVNKKTNDMLISRYLGLPRDSHSVIEGILGNSSTKMAIFLLHDKPKSKFTHLPPMTALEIDPINREHSGLTFGEEEKILSEATYQRFAKLMPTIKITAHGNLTLDHAAVLGQLWSDLTFCYSKLRNLDPGSNPEVKHVRDRAAQLLERRFYGQEP